MKLSFDTATDLIEDVLRVTHAAFGVAQPPVSTAVLAAAQTQTTGTAAAQTQTQTQTQTAGTDAAQVDVTTRDKDGLPWDVRVHSTPASMTTAGVWRAKRGRKDEEYTAVKAEYSGGQQQAAAPASPPAAGGMQKPPQMSAPPAAGKTPYQELFDYLAEMTKQGRAPADWIKSSLTDYGVADGNILNLQTADPAFVEELHDEFVKVLGE